MTIILPLLVSCAWSFIKLQGGPHKVKPTTILLAIFECVGKIQ